MNTPTPPLPGLLEPATRTALAHQLAGALQAERLDILFAEKLSGGAIQENWGLTVEVAGLAGWTDGVHDWVLRTDASSAVGSSLGRAQEYAVLRVVHAAGVPVPVPLCLLEAGSVLGRPYFVMSRLSGVGAGHRLTRDPALVPDAPSLLAELGEALARLHGVRPPCAGLEFLELPQEAPALASIRRYRAYLDTLSEPLPVLEWGLRWCERRVPPPQPLCLVHRDLRTGNYFVDGGRLAGVLDWEFAGWGDAREDIGWLTARCWRFAAPDREAGGIGPVEPLLAAYVRAGGAPMDRAELRYWQVMAHLRWSVIALQQAQRHLSGAEPSLELALTGRLVAELELEILRLVREGQP